MGRPKLDPNECTVTVQLRLPQSIYDAIAHAARQMDMSIPAVIRSRLRITSEELIRAKAQDELEKLEQRAAELRRTLNAHS